MKKSLPPPPPQLQKRMTEPVSVLKSGQPVEVSNATVGGCHHQQLTFFGAGTDIGVDVCMNGMHNTTSHWHVRVRLYSVFLKFFNDW